MPSPVCEHRRGFEVLGYKAPKSGVRSNFVGEYTPRSRMALYNIKAFMKDAVLKSKLPKIILIRLRRRQNCCLTQLEPPTLRIANSVVIAETTFNCKALTLASSQNRSIEPR